MKTPVIYHQDVVATIISFLKQEFRAEDKKIKFSVNDNLIKDWGLDSLALMELAVYLETNFNISLSVFDPLASQQKIYTDDGVKIIHSNDLCIKDLAALVCQYRLSYRERY